MILGREDYADQEKYFSQGGVLLGRWVNTLPEDFTEIF